MGIEFNRIITLLRKERGITQKQAAQDLGISQAQLSHYEKGIRECGLAFVVQVADYYDVSCDYLLGRSAERSGQTITVEELPEGKSCRVVVPDDQLSLAIGKEGQNARLAAKLTGYKIDIKPESEA